MGRLSRRFAAPRGEALLEAFINILFIHASALSAIMKARI